MVKTPTTRHSKSQREPKTIDLEPGEVARVGDQEVPETGVPEAGGPVEPEPANDQFIGSEWPPEQLTAAEADTQPERAADEPAAFGRSTSANAAGTTSTDAGGAVPPPRGGGSPFVAGLAGAVIALVGVAGLQFSGFWPVSGSSGPDADVSVLESDIAALRSDLAALKEAPGTDTTVLAKDVADGISRMDALTSTFNQLKAEFDTLRTAVENGGAGDGAAVEALNAKLSELEQRIAGLSQGSAATPAELAALTGRIAAIDAAVRAANETVASADGRLAALEQTVAALGQKVEAQEAQPKVAMALAAAALKAALDRGGPFAAEVETFAAVAPDAADLTQLRQIAATGVATRQQILGATDAAARAMIAAGHVVDQNAGILDRLWSSAESLVTVRPVGPVEGAGVPETVARMEQAVKDSDLAKAIAEYDSLPEAARTAGAEYAAMIRTRLEVEQIVDKALADALKAA